MCHFKSCLVKLFKLLCLCLNVYNTGIVVPISEGSVGMKVMGVCLPMHSTKEMLGARIIHSQQTRVKIFLYVSTGLR